MTGAQLEHAQREFETLKKELQPIANGFGFKGLGITVSLKGGGEFELVELDVVKREDQEAPYKVRGVGRHAAEKDAQGQDRPSRWFSVHFDHEQIAWVEFETFAG